MQTVLGAVRSFHCGLRAARNADHNIDLWTYVASKSHFVVCVLIAQLSARYSSLAAEFKTSGGARVGIHEGECQ